jgi:hypothetical protein
MSRQVAHAGPREPTIKLAKPGQARPRTPGHASHAATLPRDSCTHVCTLKTALLDPEIGTLRPRSALLNRSCDPPTQVAPPSALPNEVRA